MGTFGYISIVALLCYSFMLLIFMAAKKNTIVTNFRFVLLSMILWTGGSFFMRSQMWPNYIVWYHASLIGLVLLPYVYYRFINALAGEKNGWDGTVYLALMTAAMIINIYNGMFMKWPDIVEVNGVDTFVYNDITMWAGVLYGMVALMILRVLFVIMVKIGKDRTLRKALYPVAIGTVLLFVGNVAVLTPMASGFPADILAGVANAFLLFYALIRKRLFHLQMLASEGLGYGVALTFTVILFASRAFTSSQLIQLLVPLEYHYRSVIYAILFLMVYTILAKIWKTIIQNVVVKDEVRQAEILKSYSSRVSQLLELDEVMDQTVSVMKELMNFENIFICMKGNNPELFDKVYSENPLWKPSITVDADNPMVKWFENGEEVLLYDEFKSTVRFKSMWEDEKVYLDKIGLQCCAAIEGADGVIGLIFLADKNKKHRIGYNDMQMIASVTSVAAIAIRNSHLYENALKEARTDELTGLYNRKYFYQMLGEEFKKNQDGSLVLAIFNLDDFKLYNQLYGVKEGDEALQRIALIIQTSVGENGLVARYNGKEFAVLLPKYDIFSAKALAESICQQVFAMNDAENGVHKLKTVTMSVGISAAPYTAKTEIELMENADMAVYHVKHHGKNGIQIFDNTFRGEEPEATNHADIYQSYESTIYALTAAVDAKDHYTFSHCTNVEYYATELAKQMGLNTDMIEIIRQAALLHDIGKISIPEQILNKQGPLSDDEYDIMKGHVEASIDIIRHLPALDYVIPAVIGHHERYDGTGYPRRISGDNIPVTARILCIADSFDAITSRRVYKSSDTLERAKDILVEESGRQFDPEMARVFVDCLNDGRIHLVEGEYSGHKKAN